MNKWEILENKHLVGLGFHGVDLPVISPANKMIAYVLILEDKPITVVVFVTIAPGTVSCTLYPGKELFRYRRKALVAIREGMEEYAVVNEINRYEANTPYGPMFDSFMKRIGFEVESPLRKFYRGEDYLMWVKFPERE